jgi:hypothetical protein
MFGDEKSSDHCLHWNYDCFVLCVAAYMLWWLSSIVSNLIGTLAKRIGIVSSVVCLSVSFVCRQHYIGRGVRSVYGFRYFSNLKIVNTFKFMLRDAIILYTLQDLNC